MRTFTTITDFTADKFSPTTWEPAKKKARFARAFIRFVQADFPRRQFTGAFYHRLVLTFGNGARLDRHGFYDEFFTTTQDKLRFLRLALQHQPVGDPAFTYSDVERALQAWLVQNSVLARYEQRLAGPAGTATNEQLVEEIKAAYKVDGLRPVRSLFYQAMKLYDFACPLVALAIHRGVVDRNDPAIAADRADNPAVEWAAQTFGEEWSWGLVDGFDRQTERIDDPDYLEGYGLGAALAQEILPTP